MANSENDVVYGDRGDLGTTGIDEAGLRITGGHTPDEAERPVADPEAGKGERCCEDERELLKNREELLRAAKSLEDSIRPE